MSARKALFLGHVMQRNVLAHDHVKVRVIKMMLDQYLLMYFNKRKDYWALEKDVKCNIGDFVLIEELDERVSPRTRFELKEIVFKLGAVVDPVTGRRCRGTEFIDENRKTQISEESSAV
ncbi:small ribosomal subunit protein uS17m-like [Liolophura sinensis]|uniref:small ribosomal subunit protein uS17m-like n=1 Tax=Liolophura sinensis TaxID=3198878 RepID=UPI003158CC30